ncbi:MAG: clostripain-related cysteine peptidase [Promethearchaeota archaeon]
MNGSKLLFPILCLILLVPFSFLPIQLTNSPANEPHSKAGSWTIMVYLNADNDLNDQGWEDVNEMEVVGSTADVNVVALVDSYDVAIPYEIHKDTDTDEVTSQILVGTGIPSEPDMGQGTVLSAWVDYVQTNYVSTYYALIIWNHGAGFYGISFDETSQDEDEDYYLTINEVQQALTGKNLDILAADACLMGMVEVAYEWKDLADYLVLSEETIPWDGYPYDDILGDLTADPMMTPAEFCDVMVQNYADSYNGGSQGSELEATLSAINASKIDALATAIDELAMVFLSNNTYTGQASGARYKTESFSYPENIDLGDFVKELQASSSVSEINAAATHVEGNLTEAVISNRALSSHNEAEGLAILLPEAKSDYPNGYDSVLDFGVDTHWDDFIVNFTDYKLTANEDPKISSITLDKDRVTPETSVTVDFYVEADTMTSSPIVNAEVYYRDYLLWSHVSATQLNGTDMAGWWRGTVPAISGGAGHNLEISCRATDAKGAIGQGLTTIYITQTAFDPKISDLFVTPLNVTIFTDVTILFRVQTYNNSEIIPSEVQVLYKDFIRWYSVTATQFNGTLVDGWWQAVIPAISGGDGHVLQIRAVAKDALARSGASRSYITVIGSLGIPTPGFTFLMLLIPLIAIVIIKRSRKEK